MKIQRLFVSGSKQIKDFNEIGCRGVDVIDEAIKRGAEILVGDCHGADTVIQQHIARRGYRNVTVYVSGLKEPRHNEGDWPVKHIVLDGSLSAGFDFYRQKDIQMIRDCDAALVIWNGESRGTRQNIIELRNLNKETEIIWSGKSVRGAFSGVFWKIDGEIYAFPDYGNTGKLNNPERVWPYVKPKSCRRKPFDAYSYGTAVIDNDGSVTLRCVSFGGNNCFTHSDMHGLMALFDVRDTLDFSKEQ